MSNLGQFIKRARSKSPGNTDGRVESNPTDGSQADPILTEEDESFLLKVTSDDEIAPELPPRPTQTLEKDQTQDKQSKWKKWDDWWATHNLPTREGMSLAVTKTLHRKGKDKKDDDPDKETIKDGETVAGQETERQDVDEEQAPDPPAKSKEAKKEKRDLGKIMKDLHLSSINNRVVGLSKDTRGLLQRFNQVLKDLVNGVPTAYQDLEKLLTEREEQLDKLYDSLPSWLQNLVKTVPTKAYEYVAPGLAATIGAGKAAEEGELGKGKGKKSYVPNLKDLIGKKGAVAAMLRSILGFLEARFPAFLTGTNVLLSLAVFILLFVFWYCHKRGRDTRLERERSGQKADGYDVAEDVDSDSLDELESQVNLRAVPDEANNKDAIVEKGVGRQP